MTQKTRTLSETDMACVCDAALVKLAALTMDQGIPLATLFDRMLTYVMAHEVRDTGSKAAANLLRDLAQNVEDGALEAVRPQGAVH